MARWVGDLSDGDESVRERARFELLGLTPDQLPRLKEAILALRPLMPGQAAVLRQVVTHVYMSGEPYEAVADGAGFIGLHWPDRPPIPVRLDPGIPVSARLPGFCGYRYLQTGDIILQIVGQPDVDCHSLEQFMLAISRLKAGDTVRLRVLRKGTELDVPIVLDRRPLVPAAGADATIGWVIARQKQADEYWQREFAPVMEEPLAAGE